jgi:hypothetical protein
MRPIHCVLAAFATVFAAGCAHRANHGGHAAGTSAPHAATPGPAAPAARSRLMHIYVDAAAPAAAAPFAADLTHADTVARALRDQLRRLGYDVRGTDSALPRHDAGAAPGDIARSVAAGQPPPDTSRAVTYLHPNAPRLLLFVHLQEDQAVGNTSAAPSSVVLGAFIADSTDGAVLWSNRVSAPPPATDDQLRLLASRLIRTLPSPPPA